ncbi:hypothetical protein K438DRAFT_1835762 [Mycena galopus ATCC 62051]|nr:hypothetical protein K438DRAFT_1835762 [Mycena galopus ATCC 62051]
MAPLDTASPALPPELERAIFEICATVSWSLIPKFMLVAWRVKTWLEPLLYRTIVVGSQLDPFSEKYDGPVFPIACDALMSLINSKDPTFFRDSVCHLYLAHHIAEEEAIILSACSGIEDLWLAAQTSVIVPQFKLSLKRLHCTLETMFGSSDVDFTNQFFFSITHLEIFNVPDNVDVEVWSALTRLPHLTHLAFNDDDYIPMCAALLPSWESLRVLVILLSANQNTNIGSVLLHQYGATGLAQDPRFVVIVCSAYLEDWIKGAHIGCDYWSQAEDFIAKRKSGEVDALQCYVRDGDGENDADSEEEGI